MNDKLTEAEAQELDGLDKTAVLAKVARDRGDEFETAQVLGHLDAFSQARPDATAFSRAAEARAKGRQLRDETIAELTIATEFYEACLGRLDGLMSVRREIPSEVQRLINLSVADGGVAGMSRSDMLAAQTLEIVAMGQTETRVRALAPADVVRLYETAVERMDCNRGDQFTVRVIEQLGGSLVHDGSDHAIAATLALQTRIKAVRETRVPKAVREKRDAAEADLVRTRRLLAVRRTLPQWDTADSDRVLASRHPRMPSSWEKTQYGPQLHVPPSTTLEGA